MRSTAILKFASIVSFVVIVIIKIFLIPISMASISIAEETKAPANNAPAAEKKPAVAPPNKPEVEIRKLEVAPLIERYIMDELKSLRQDLASARVNLAEMRAQIIQEVTDRELAVAQAVSNVANNTVTFFFYVFAGLGAGFAVWGWRSLHDIKDAVREASELEIARLSREYEQRLTNLERELHSKGEIILDNQREIERTQNIHALWLQANQTPDARIKIEIYDKILELSPGDQETMAYKADAALQLGDRDWALSLCNRILTDNPESSAALYQRACAYAGLGNHEAAIVDLKLALELSPTLKERLLDEEEFAVLSGNADFESLTSPSDQ